MNDKCAAGTGRFLDMMAKTLELTLPEMSELGLQWKNEGDNLEYVYGICRVRGCLTGGE
ncbi:MAG: hypothetical protein ACLRRQ_12320 [Lachnospira pectinoschiza]